MLPRTLIAAAGVICVTAALAPFDMSIGHANSPAAEPAQVPRSFEVGDIAPRDGTHIVSRPGLYGLSVPPEGDVYAVLGGQLVRLDATSRKILSRMRPVDAIVD
ncbi:hypothetical protein [Paracoccus sp. PARArs4]|uniref:hypothetical protein n=1 Tax=Paracoccus sp. PARArs4 TaxID=2853442 RepID=UPI0024A6676F|nr:hypothetical protein [Paracoccus sp. PARArs4]